VFPNPGSGPVAGLHSLGTPVGLPHWSSCRVYQRPAARAPSCHVAPAGLPREVGATAMGARGMLRTRARVRSPVSSLHPCLHVGLGQ